MARPTNQARLDRATDEAENLIRNNLVELTRVAINTALLPAEVELVCQHCKKKTKGKLEGTTGDAQLALKLLERIAGKPTEKRESGVTGDLEKLLVALSGEAEDTSAADAAAAAKEAARKRATAAAILKTAAVTP